MVTLDGVDTKTGALLSTTVMDFVAVVTLPDASVAVKVMTFVPTSEQVKFNCEAARVTVPQLSVEEPKAATVVEPVPVALKVTVTGAEDGVITGAKASITITTTVRVVVLPATSVAVTVTTLEPLSAHAKVDLLKATVGVLQLSDKPLTTAALVKVAEPEAFKFKTTGVPMTFKVGAMTSVTVTGTVTVEILLLLSRTVTTTLLTPKSVHEKTDLLNTTERIPQLSDATTPKEDAEIIAFPLAGKDMLSDAFAVTVGSALSTTVTKTVLVVKLPVLSEAVKTTD